MGLLTNVKNKITAYFTNNNAKQITGVQTNEVTTDMLNAVFQYLVVNGEIPYWDSTADQLNGNTALKFDSVNKELLIEAFRLKYGQTGVNYIHNSGTFTGVASRTLVTKRYVDARRTVIGTISVNVPINSELRVGQTVTLDGGIEHTVAEGDTFLLKSQTDPAENVPYTAVAADAAPVIAEWYSAEDNQEISILKGPTTKQVMPAVAEGEDPVIETPLQAQQITLLSTGWSGNSYSFDTAGVLSILENSNILISPATKADSDLYADAEIFCASQAANTLVFSCVNAPTSDVVLNVIVL